VRSPYTRSPWYYHAARFEPGKDNVFTDCDNDSHDARRKKMISAVSKDYTFPGPIGLDDLLVDIYTYIQTILTVR
jgi:hypothetical protein